MSLLLALTGSEPIPPDPPVEPTFGATTLGWRWANERGRTIPQAPAVPRKVERAIERTARDATPSESRAVLEAAVERAGESWDERFYELLEEMRRREVETLAALRDLHYQMELADDEDAIAVVLMLLH